MNDLLTFLTNSYGSFMDACEFWASKLLHEMPYIFGLRMGTWILLFMVTGIILGDFIND